MKPTGYSAMSTIRVPLFRAPPPGGGLRKPEMPDKLKCTFGSAATAVPALNEILGLYQQSLKLHRPR